MNSGIGEYCCARCFSDSAIQEYVESHGTPADCDFCKTRNVHCAHVTDVGKFIMEGVEKKYEDPANSVFHDSSEGGYDIEGDCLQDLLIWEEQIFSDHIDDPEPLFNVLINPDGTLYVRKDPYGPESGGDDDIRSWEAFRKLVKGNRRFAALHKYNEEKEDGDPAVFLRNLVSTLARDFLTTISPKEKIYRGRRLKAGTDFFHKDLTSPPPNKSGNNRMSPKGVSFFYGAMDTGTCVAELRPSVGEQIAVAEFELLRELTVIDLATAIPYHSIFDDEYKFHRDEFILPFVRRFADSISEPVQISDSDLEYVPTQVFTEFLRFHPKHQFDGIQYKSSLRSDGINIVLFKEEGISCEDPSDPDAWLCYKGFEAVQVKSVSVDFESIA